MSQRGDEELLVEISTERGRADRNEEFSAFMVVHAAALHRTAYLLCGDPHRADDLTQHALERTYRAWGRASEGDPLAYARRVLINLRIDAWRRPVRTAVSLRSARLAAVLLVVLACTSACGPPVRMAAVEARDTAYGVAAGMEDLVNEDMDPAERVRVVRHQLRERERVLGAEKTLYGSRTSGDTATFDLAFDESAQNSSGGFFGEQAFVRLCVSLVVALQGPVAVHLEDAPCAGPTALDADSTVVEVDLEDD
jgi:DNA-directed RNA polymerase specialized sigma24 family protein